MAVVDISAHTQPPVRATTASQRRPSHRPAVPSRAPVVPAPPVADWADPAGALAAFVSAGAHDGPVDFWAEAAEAERRRARLVAGWNRPAAALMASAVGIVALDLAATALL